MRTTLQFALVLVLATNITARATDFSQVLFDFRGDPILDDTRPGPRDPQTGKFTPPRFCFREDFERDPKQCDAFRLGIAASTLLMRYADPDTPDISPDELKRRADLGKKLAGMNNVELSPEDKVLIRRLAKKNLSPGVASAVIEALDK